MLKTAEAAKKKNAENIISHPRWEKLGQLGISHGNRTKNMLCALVFYCFCWVASENLLDMNE